MRNNGGATRAVCMEKVRPARAVCMEKVRPARAVCMEQVRPARAVCMEKVRPARAVCMEKVRPARAVCMEKVIGAWPARVVGFIRSSLFFSIHTARGLLLENRDTRPTVW